MKARIAHAHRDCNAGKLEQLSALQAVYRAFVQQCVDCMVAAKRHHVKPSEYQRFFPASTMSSQLRKCAVAQAVNIVGTWARGRYARLKPRIFEQPFTDHQRMQLRCVGKYMLTKAGKFGKGTIGPDMVQLYWSWVWDPAIAGNTPVMSDAMPMWLSEMCVAYGPAKSSKLHVGWWLRASCLVNGKRVAIPLAENPWLDNADHFAKSVLVRKADGQWLFQFTDKTPETETEHQPGDVKIGVDVGLNVLAADSSGRLYGTGVKREFDRRYRHIQALRANRQRQQLSRDSRRLARAERKLTGFIKTHVGAVANQLVRQHPGATFVVENLDLRGCRGQKRFAYRQLHKSLQHKACTQVANPAYTSQACPSCGYVSKLNRSGTSFRCRCCGRVSHADVVGAINLLGRSEDQQVTAQLHHTAVKALLDARFRQRRTSAPARRRKRATVAPGAYCGARGRTAPNVR